MFMDFLMFFQIFISPQVKRSAIISYTDGIYVLSQKLPNNLRLRYLHQQCSQKGKVKDNTKMTPDQYLGPQASLLNYVPYAPPRSTRPTHTPRDPRQVPRAPYSCALKSFQDRFVVQLNISIFQRLFKRLLTALFLCGSKNSCETL